MHRVENKQTYTTCRGGATSVYPETVVVDEHEPGSRTVRVHHADKPARQYDIPVTYFHETALTRQGRLRKTGYYLIRSD